MGYTYPASEIAQMLHDYRDRENLTLRDLAQRTLISASTLQRIEAAERGYYPDMPTILRLLNTCGFALTDFVKSDDEEGNAQIQGISMQLRAPGQVSSAALQALDALIRAVREQQASTDEPQ